jgi:hypothetical protein
VTVRPDGSIGASAAVLVPAPRRSRPPLERRVHVEVTVVDEHVATEYLADERESGWMVDELHKRFVEAHEAQQMQRRFAALAPNAIDGARQPRDPLRVERVFEQDEAVAVETLSQRAHRTSRRVTTTRSRAKPQHTPHSVASKTTTRLNVVPSI